VKPRKTCVEVAGRRTFRILTSSQQSGIKVKTAIQILKIESRGSETAVILLTDYTGSILEDGNIHLAALRNSQSDSPINNYHVYNQPKLGAKFRQKVLFLLFCNRKTTYLNTSRPAERCPFHYFVFSTHDQVFRTYPFLKPWSSCCTGTLTYSMLQWP